MSVEVLRKALNSFRDVLLDNDACDHILSEYDCFHDLFSVFQAEYDKQVHVPRKRLELSLAKERSLRKRTGKQWAGFFYEQLGYRITDSDEDAEMLKKLMDKLLCERKELLEAGLENIPHEKETKK